MYAKREFPHHKELERNEISKMATISDFELAALFVDDEKVWGF